jgi:hypothetical protein
MNIEKTVYSEVNTFLLSDRLTRKKECGIRAGTSLSPLLGTLYLSPPDLAMEELIKKKPQMIFVFSWCAVLKIPMFVLPDL